jgi:hypothetical protein
MSHSMWVNAVWASTIFASLAATVVVTTRPRVFTAALLAAVRLTVHPQVRENPESTVKALDARCTFQAFTVSVDSVCRLASHWRGQVRRVRGEEYVGDLRGRTDSVDIFSLLFSPLQIEVC